MSVVHVCCACLLCMSVVCCAYMSVCICFLVHICCACLLCMSVRHVCCICLLCICLLCMSLACACLLFLSVVHVCCAYMSVVHMSVVHMSVVHMSVVHMSVVHMSVVHMSVVHMSVVHMSVVHMSVAHVCNLYMSLVPDCYAWLHGVQTVHVVLLTCACSPSHLRYYTSRSCSNNYLSVDQCLNGRIYHHITIIITIVRIWLDLGMKILEILNAPLNYRVFLACNMRAPQSRYNAVYLIVY